MAPFLHLLPLYGPFGPFMARITLAFQKYMKFLFL